MMKPRENTLSTFKSLKPEKPSGYIPTLDGWRAISILAVLFCHDSNRFPELFRIPLFVAGSRGVEMFFALSGFLICSRLLREEAASGTISLRNFYLRRVVRIQPASLVYLLTISFLTLAGLLPYFWKGILGSLFMVRNFWPSNATYPSWYTAHFWSLSVEEHFYLLFPLFLVLVKRYRLAILIGVLLVLDLWAMMVTRHAVLQHFGQNIFFRTDLRLGPIVMGCLLAIVFTLEGVRTWTARFLPPWVVMAYTALVYWRIQTHNASYNDALSATVYPLLIAATVTHARSLTGRTLELVLVRYIGRLSYSLYLWQQLFFLLHEGADYPAPNLLQRHVLLCYGASFACAAASYYLVETPMIRFGHRLTRRPYPKPMAA